jgi:hypothetical protein
MRIVVFGALAFAVIFGGGLLGFLLSRCLPQTERFAAGVMSLNLPRFVVASPQPMQTALGEISAP